MKLKFLTISDTHLGEDSSLLSFPHGRQRVWEALRGAFGEGDENHKFGKEGRFDVEEVILLGDIPDRCLSSTVQLIAHTTDFMKMLGSAANISKGIYIPGNHDHTLWTDYILRRSNLQTRVTGPEGELLVEQGEVHSDPVSVEELLTIFFGYEKGSLWRDINSERKFNFAIANPIYAKEFKERTYVFAHGTHFRPDVTQPEWVKRMADWSQADRLAGIEIESDCDISKAKDIEDLEEITSRFVDSLWVSSKDNPNSRSDRLWYLSNLISGKFSQRRPSPPADQLYSWAELQDDSQGWISKLSGENNKLADDSLERWKKYFADHMFEYLIKHGLLQKDITFVYGDTHRGGWGELERDGNLIRIYNTGGWTTTHKENHPACHIFAVDTEGKEYLLDVSFEEVVILGKSLIELAAEDAEDRNSTLGKTIRFFLEHVMPDW